MLHKCDDEAGCCENDAFHCVAKHQQPVTLFFYVVLVNGSSVEQLTFTNDTECECREVNYQPRKQEDMLTTISTTTSTTTMSSDYFGLDEKPAGNSLQLNKGKEVLCEHIDCPNPFAAQLVTQRPPRCKCDCVDDDVLCLRIKRGLKRLSREWNSVYE